MENSETWGCPCKGVQEFNLLMTLKPTTNVSDTTQPQKNAFLAVIEGLLYLLSFSNRYTDRRNPRKQSVDFPLDGLSLQDHMKSSKGRWVSFSTIMYAQVAHVRRRWSSG